MKQQNDNISQREQLLAITSAIILAGMVANCTTLGPSDNKILVARITARDLLNSILEKEKASE